MKLLTVKDVAAIIQAKPSTIYAWAEQGSIPCFKLNGLLRFAEDEIKAWIRSCKSQSVSYNYLADRRPGKEGK